MFEALQNGLTGAFKTLRGQGKLSESNMRDGLKLVEKSLLEADVSFAVVRDFMQRITDALDGDDGAASAQDKYARRRLHMSEMLDGMVKLDGLLDAELGQRMLFKYIGSAPPYNFVNIVIRWD